MSSSLSPLAPSQLPDLPEIGAVRLYTAEAGIKYKNRADLLIMAFDETVSVAGAFTTSRCPSAAVDHCRWALGNGRAKVLIVNSGNANAFTGKKGREAVENTVTAAAKVFSARAEEVYVASTGVIGEPLDSEKITNQLAAFPLNEASWLEAGRAIMTTDTFPKMATAAIDLDGVPIRMNAIAKGAGMIAPNMATMLCFVVTDAAIDHRVLQAMLPDAVDQSFNSISVDSDTSTSDSLLVFATGACQKMAPITTIDDYRVAPFKDMLSRLLRDLALQVVRDGEGAHHLLKVVVDQAISNESAKKIAFAIANSPLVKTAIAGEDANWGRVVMAVGKAGEPADRDKLAIWFNEIRVAKDGERDQDYSEDKVSKSMKQTDITIRVSIGLGDGHATVWGCDLTKEYVEINGDYRS